MAGDILDTRRDEVLSLYPRVFAQCRKMLSREADPHGLAENLTQEIMIRAIRGLGNFKGSSSVSSWLYRITHNTVMTYFRSTRRNPMQNLVIGKWSDGHKYEESVTLAAGGVEDTVDINPDNNPLHLLMKKKLREEVALLSPKRRRVMELRIDGYSFAEIAEIVGIEVNTAKTHYIRGYQVLAGKFHEAK